MSWIRTRLSGTMHNLFPRFRDQLSTVTLNELAQTNSKYKLGSGFAWIRP